VNNGRDDGIDRLHAACRSRRRLVLLFWMLMAFLQFGLGVICAVLAWTRYIHSAGILIPSSVRFCSFPLCSERHLMVYLDRFWVSHAIRYRLCFSYVHQR
jgi:hypothetical protein